MRRVLLASALVVLLLWPASAHARQPQKYRWSELGARITNRTTALVLPDGTHVAGKVLRVEPGGLVIKVPKGERSIPAQAVSYLRVSENTKRWRIICTAAFPIVVVGAIAGAARDLPEEGATGAGIVWGSLAGGYFLGWALDRKTTEIEIVRGQP